MGLMTAVLCLCVINRSAGVHAGLQPRAWWNVLAAALNASSRVL